MSSADLFCLFGGVIKFLCSMRDQISRIIAGFNRVFWYLKHLSVVFGINVKLLCIQIYWESKV